MEQIKIKSRDSIILNVIIFLLLGLGFLYLEYAYRHHLSPLSFVLLKKSVYIFWLPISILLISIFSIWNCHKKSGNWFIAFVLTVTFKISEGLFLEFNKLIIVGLFSFLVVAFFLYQILEDYFNKSYMNPNYSKSDLFDPLLLKIETSVLSCEQFVGDATLTNWDEFGCFIKLNSEVKSLKNISLIIHFKNRDFEQSGKVVTVTRDKFGIGIKFNQSNKKLDVFNWSEFVEIVDELGFAPERLR